MKETNPKKSANNLMPNCLVEEAINPFLLIIIIAPFPDSILKYMQQAE